HVVESVLAAGLARVSPSTITNRAAFLRELRTTQQRGYGLNLGEWVPDVVGISAPVFGPAGAIEGAMGVAGPTSRLNARDASRVGRVVRRYADRLSAKLGTVRR